MLSRADLCAAAAALIALLCLAVRVRGHAWLAVSSVAVAVGALQMIEVLRPSLATDHIARHAGSAVEVSAYIGDRPSAQWLRTRLLLEVEAVSGRNGWTPAQGRILVTVHHTTHPWQRGDRVRVRLPLRRPRNFGNPGEFDYQAFLARRRVYVTAFAPSDAAWERAPASGHDVAGWFDRWRADVDRVLAQTLGGAQREIAAALLIGDNAGLSLAVRDRYARAGVSHVLSISGLHIALVLGGAYGIFRWLLARSEWLLLRGNVPKLALGLTCLPIVFYGGIAGFTVPTVRAIVMVLLLCVATLLDRHRDWLTGLAGAAAVISLLWPGSIFEISFQLSFASVYGIVVGMQRFGVMWSRWEEARLIRLRSPAWRHVRWAILYGAVSVCATAATAPLTAYHFNQVSLIAVVANPLVVPLLGFVPVSAGLVAAVFAPVAPALASALLQVVGVAIAVADTLVALLARIPGAAVRTVTPSGLELSLLYLLLAALFGTSRRRSAVVAVAGALLLSDAAWWYVERHHGGALRVTFLSVGQGDCTIVEFPHSAVMVVDGGGLMGTFDVGERLVAPYLWRRKITSLETLVLTHPQFDHYGGLAFLGRTFAPPFLWWNGSSGTGPRFAEFWKSIEDAGSRPLRVARGFRATIDGVEVLVLAPGDDDAGSVNDRSLTLQLRYGPVSVLLPGDIEALGESRLVAAAAGRLRSTVLKVPHHGSRTSSTAPFLDAVAPRLAVISAGDSNRFGMPHNEVLAAYAQRNIPVLRTDVDGAIKVEVTGEGVISVTTGRNRNGKWQMANGKSLKFGEQKHVRD